MISGLEVVNVFVLYTGASKSRSRKAKQLQQLVAAAQHARDSALEKDSRKQVNSTVKQFVAFCATYDLDHVVHIDVCGIRTHVVNPNAITAYIANYCTVKKNKAGNLDAVQSLLKRGMRETYLAIWPTEVGPPYSYLVGGIIKDTIKGFKKQCPRKAVNRKMPWLLDYTHDIATRAKPLLPPLPLKEFEARTTLGNRACMRNKSIINIKSSHVSFDYGEHTQTFICTKKSIAKLRRTDELWMSVLIHSEKTGKVREPRTIRFNYVGGSRCAVQQVLDWVTLANISHGHLLFGQSIPRTRKLKKWTHAKAAKQLIRLAESIKLPPGKVGTHSLRRGGVADYLHEDVPLEFILYVGGWKSLAFLNYFAPTDHVMVAMFHRLRRSREPSKRRGRPRTRGR